MEKIHQISVIEQIHKQSQYWAAQGDILLWQSSENAIIVVGRRLVIKRNVDCRGGWSHSIDVIPFRDGYIDERRESEGDWGLDCGEILQQNLQILLRNQQDLNETAKIVIVQNHSQIVLLRN